MENMHSLKRKLLLEKLMQNICKGLEQADEENGVRMMVIDDAQFLEELKKEFPGMF